jgi:hypothetical protein
MEVERLLNRLRKIEGLGRLQKRHGFPAGRRALAADKTPISLTHH